MKIQFDANEMGKKIKHYREQMHMTVKELAISSCRPVEQIEAIEEGIKYPSLRAIEDIANALNVEPSWLLAWKPEDEE